MAPTPAQGASSLLPQGGMLNPPSAQSLISGGTGAIRITAIVFTIFCTLGVVTVLIFILKRRPKSPPLPPIQPLAHYREREVKYLPRPYLPHEELDKGSKSGSEEGPLGQVRTSSIRTADSPCSRATSGSYERASPSQEYVSTTQLARSSSLSRSRSRHELTRNPSMSMVSTRSISTHTSSRSTNSIRGAPHCPHNNIEVVLPAPLAPQLWDRMTANPSAIQGYGDSREHGGLISDQWMATFISPTLWCPSTDQGLFEGDPSPKRHTCPRSGCQDRPSLDTANQLEQPESHPRPRVRSPLRRTSQPKSSGQGTPITSLQSTDNQIRLPKPTAQDSCDGQAMSPPLERQGRPRSKLRSRSSTRSCPRRKCPPCDLPNSPCPRSASRSCHSFSPSWKEEPPPPVPPLPKLPQPLLRKPETHLANAIQPSSLMSTIMTQ